MLEPRILYTSLWKLVWMHQLCLPVHGHQNHAHRLVFVGSSFKKNLQISQPRSDGTNG